MTDTRRFLVIRYYEKGVTDPKRVPSEPVEVDGAFILESIINGTLGPNDKMAPLGEEFFYYLWQVVPRTYFSDDQLEGVQLLEDNFPPELRGGKWVPEKAPFYLLPSTSNNFN